jgi:hypothetical protein
MLLLQAAAQGAARTVDTVFAKFTGPLMHFPDTIVTVSPETTIQWLSGVSTIAVALLAGAAIGVEIWRERRANHIAHARREAMDARIGAVAYALQYQLKTWLLEAPKPVSHPSAANVFEAMKENRELAKTDRPDPGDRDGYMRLANVALSWVGDRERLGHYSTAEQRIEQLVADAPEADNHVGRRVREAYVLFRRATRRWSHEATRGLPRWKELIAGYEDLRECINRLDEPVGSLHWLEAGMNDRNVGGGSWSA